MSSAGWGCCAAQAPGRITVGGAVAGASGRAPSQSRPQRAVLVRVGPQYKKCHLGREQLTLAERVKWLYAKAAQYADLSGWRELLAEVGYERYRHTHDLAEALDAGMADPLVMDVVLFEAGAFAEFLQVRGSLLPDDERLLAEQWLLVDRSVFEVQTVNPGESTLCETYEMATCTRCVSGRRAAG